MKGCGKSAPRPRQRGRHGKPHREQDRIGAIGRDSSELPAGGFPRRRPGRSREASGNGRPRRMAIHRPSGRGQDPAYRPSGAFQGSGDQGSGAIPDSCPLPADSPIRPHAKTFSAGYRAMRGPYSRPEPHNDANAARRHVVAVDHGFCSSSGRGHVPRSPLGARLARVCSMKTQVPKSRKNKINRAIKASTVGAKSGTAR